MSQRESDTSIPIPEDELKKARLWRNRVNMSENLGFEEFQLAQKMKAKEYGKDLSSANEQDKKDILLVTLAEYLADMELWPEKTNNSGQNIIDKNSEKRNKIYDAYANACLSIIEMINIKYPRFLSVKSFIIDKGILSLFVITPPRTDIQMLPINLHWLFKKWKWNQIILDEKNLTLELRWRAKEDISKLRESLETESLFWWAIVVTYEKKEVAKKALWYGLWALWAVWWFNTGEYIVRKMLFRDENGKMQEVDPKIIRNILKWIGDKTKINSMIFRIMRESGRVYNSIRNSFTDIYTIGVDRAVNRIKWLKRLDIEKWKTMTDAEFESEKSKMIQEIVKTPRSTILAKSTEFLKWSTNFINGVAWKGIHYIFWWVFFTEYHKNTYDIVNLYKWIAETWLFYAGANIGSRFAPWLWKIPASLVWWWVGVVWWNALGGAMGIDKKMWRMMPDRVSWDGSKSVLGHIAFWGVVNDFSDATGTDIWVPGTRGGATLYNPFWKDGIMPNVDFAGTHITFGTNPREYLQSRIWWTDTHWNARMSEYVSWATTMTMKILEDYDNNRGYFIKSNGRKEELLKERLRHVFDNGDGKYSRNQQIIDDCIDYVTSKLTKIGDLNSRKELLSIFLGNYGNILKIDKESLEYDQKILDTDKSIMDGHRGMYSSLISAEKRWFIDKLFVRLTKWDILVSWKMVAHSSDVIWPDIEAFVPDKKEIAIYRSLIDDQTPVKEEWYDILGYKEEIVDFRKWIKIPNSIVQIGWKNVYLDWWVSIMNSEYARATQQKDIEALKKLDAKYSLHISSEFQKNPALFQKNIFSGKLWEYFIVEHLCWVNNHIKDIVSSVNWKPKPTQWDVFIYLLNSYTELREQARYIQKQKNIGYANDWHI